MTAEYKDLHALIFQNVDARQYYNELPKQIRDRLNHYADDINTYESLREHVEKMNSEV